MRDTCPEHWTLIPIGIVPGGPFLDPANFKLSATYYEALCIKRCRTLCPHGFNASSPHATTLRFSEAASKARRRPVHGNDEFHLRSERKLKGAATRPGHRPLGHNGAASAYAHGRAASKNARVSHHARQYYARHYIRHDLPAATRALEDRLNTLRQRRRLYLIDTRLFFQNYDRLKLCAISRWIRSERQRRSTFVLTNTFLHIYFTQLWSPRRLVRPRDVFYIIIPFSRPREKVDLTKAIRDAADKHIPMLIIDTVGPPRIAFKPGSPISIEALSTRSLADTLTRRAVFGPNRMNLCTCATFPTASCQTTKLCPGEKHLYSVDPDVLRSPSLSEYLDLGSTCRTVNGEDIFEDLYEYIESCLGDYLGHVEESTGFDTSLLHDFYNAALASVRDLVNDWQLAESTNAEDPSAKALRDLSTLAKLALNDWDDVIALTICDKHADMFCVTCKLGYGINAWNYLETQRDTYVPTRETEPALVARIAATCAAFADV